MSWLLALSYQPLARGLGWLLACPWPIRFFRCKSSGARAILPDPRSVCQTDSQTFRRLVVCLALPPGALLQALSDTFQAPFRRLAPGLLLQVPSRRPSNRTEAYASS